MMMSLPVPVPVTPSPSRSATASGTCSATGIGSQRLNGAPGRSAALLVQVYSSTS